MEGCIIYSIFALLLAGTSASDVHDNGNHSFVIPLHALNLTDPPTTLSTVNESETTILSLSTVRNFSEHESTSLSTQDNADNATTETTESASDEPTIGDITATDSSGCQFNLKSRIEDTCHEKFEETILSHEDITNSEACCALEDYEKCALNGFRRSNCQIDQKELKSSLNSAKLLVAAMAKVNCAEYKADCTSASVVYPLSLALTAVPVLLLFL